MKHTIATYIIATVWVACIIPCLAFVGFFRWLSREVDAAGPLVNNTIDRVTK